VLCRKNMHEEESLVTESRRFKKAFLFNDFSAQLSCRISDRRSGSTCAAASFSIAHDDCISSLTL